MMYDYWILELKLILVRCFAVVGRVCEVDKSLEANYGGAAWAAKSDGCARKKIGNPGFQE